MFYTPKEYMDTGKKTSRLSNKNISHERTQKNKTLLHILRKRIIKTKQKNLIWTF